VYKEQFPFPENMVINKEMMRPVSVFFLDGVIAFYFQCFDAIGWVMEKAFGPQKPCFSFP